MRNKLKLIPVQQKYPKCLEGEEKFLYILGQEDAVFQIGWRPYLDKFARKWNSVRISSDVDWKPSESGLYFGI